MFLSERHEFPSAPCLAEKKSNLITARVLMLLKSRASLTCFRTWFLLGRVRDLSEPSTTVISLAVNILHVNNNLVRLPSFYETLLAVDKDRFPGQKHRRFSLIEK